MTPYRLNKLLSKFPLLKGVLLYLFHIYEKCVWYLFDLFFVRYIKIYPSAFKAPQKIRSVLHISNLSHKPYMLSRLMRKKGLESSYLVIHPEAGWLQVGKKGYDYSIPWTISSSLFRPFINIYYLWKVMRHYDVIHYHFVSFLTSDGCEMSYLEKMGKIIAVHFRGCDLRQKSINMKLNPELNCCQECDYPPGTCERPVQFQRIAIARKYADLLFVTTPDLLDFLPESEHIPFIAPYGMNIDTIEPAPKNEGVFRVVTSSNHHGVDGTEYVRQAVEKLKEEGKSIELVEVHKTPYEKALAIYKSANAYAGKLRMGYYNNSNIECMLMGIPCMSYIREKYLKNIPDCPVIITRPDTVYRNLKDYIERPKELKEIGLKGIAFVKKYHDPYGVVDMLINKYNMALQVKIPDKNN